MRRIITLFLGIMGIMLSGCPSDVDFSTHTSRFSIDIEKVADMWNMLHVLNDVQTISLHRNRNTLYDCTRELDSFLNTSMATF